jgi:hypothetical protein
VAVNEATGQHAKWKEAWISVHHDGPVTMAAAVGAYRNSAGGSLKGHQVEGRAIECAVADLMALTRAAGYSTGNDEYDLRVGIEWTGPEPLRILTIDGTGRVYEDVSTPLYRFVPVEVRVDAGESDADAYRHLYDLALDCVNQGGISNLHMMSYQPEDGTCIDTFDSQP